MDPVLLLVFDGFGVSPARRDNGWAQARTPHLDGYFAAWPHIVLQASGTAVGLPDCQFGNSEVGHMTLGAGRVLEQDLGRIRRALDNGEVRALAAWQGLAAGARRLHLLGLVSDGGVHAHVDHLLGILRLLHAAAIEPVIHMITDGRDAPPRSAGRYLAMVNEALQGKPGRIGTVSGRYYAMDRAGHWDRTRRAWAAIIKGEGRTAETAEDALAQAYARGETDEFIAPTVVGETALARVPPEERILDFNFRSDRARQLVAAIGLPAFDAFNRGLAGARDVTCMTQYDAQFPFPVLFAPDRPRRVLAEVLSDCGLRQFRCAETEKYPHVTYFFNGGRETPFAGEERAIIASPMARTYDLTPEMSARAVADRTIAAIASGRYAFVLVNFANADMVGHTAVRSAIIEAVETLDRESHRIIEAALAKGFRILLTADHGNCEEMIDPLTGEPHTRHTAYPVPFLLAGARVPLCASGGGLADVAPTILELLGIDQPSEMSGRSLLRGGTATKPVTARPRDG